jgi:hypothetical protein
MTVKGDAAIDAQQFANYFWKYLEEIPSWDKLSCSMKNSTSDIKDWSDNARAPQFGDFEANTGSTPILTVARNGNWPSVRGFPVQVADGLRDFFINVLAALAEARLGHGNSVVPFVTRALDDSNPRFRSALKGAQINPAAWASRHARNYAIGQAQSSIRFSQQKFVMDDLMTQSNYKQLVSKINEVLKTKWDGYIWPYDTLSALGYALTNISLHAPQSDGVQIVGSTPSIKESYEDPVSGQQFKHRLAGVMKGMRDLGYIKPEGNISDIVDKRLTYKRVVGATNPGDHGNHSKLIVVDDSVCYVGSDNVYPSYNEEFGVWLDNDARAISSFVSDYWKGLWNFAKPG